MSSEPNGVPPVAVTPMPVKDHEIIGRRLQRDHVRHTGDEVRYSWQAFFDSRVEEDLSVDLIGEYGNAKACRAMQATAAPIARKDFEKAKAKSPFVGWAGMRRKATKYPVVRTPITDGDNPNQLHCDIVRDKYRDKELARAFAFVLCREAEEENLYVVAPPSPNSPTTTEVLQSAENSNQAQS